MVIGYDGQVYKVGDRVEVHAGMEIARRGMRFGIVQDIGGPQSVVVKLDRREAPVEGNGLSFRRIDG